MDIFEYQPLRLTKPDLRLLIIKPGAWEDHLKAEIKNVSMEDNVKYKAISYCWGSAERVLPVQIGEQTLWVTRNAWGALRNVRSKTEHICVWLDAVCIDHANPFERNHQVAMMGQIYRRAEATLGWLGEDHGEIARAKQQIERLLQEFSQATNEFDYRTMEKIGISTPGAGAYLLSEREDVKNYELVLNDTASSINLRTG